MPAISRATLPGAVLGLALLATVAGLVTWGWVLIPGPRADDTVVATLPPASAGEGGAAARWFSNRPAQVELNLSGLLATGGGAVAILSVNEASARAYRVGDQLARGVNLVAIKADGVVIDRAGQSVHLAMAALPDTPPFPNLGRR